MKFSASSSNAERALDILLLLGEVGPEGYSLAEIASRIGTAKPAAHRTLAAMVSKGFAEPTERYGHYRLGTAVPMLARRQERLEPLVQRYRPGMTEFARRTGFNVYLIVQSGIDAICAEMISRSSRHQFAMGLGARVPMGVGAGSLALMSLLSENVVEQILDANAERYQAHPSIRPVDRDIIRNQVIEAKHRGYAVNQGFFFFGEGGVGLPRMASGMYEINMAFSFNAPLDMMNEAWVEDQVGQLRECLP
ncbi:MULTISPECIES: IclR family transcriptional regulator [Rhizobium]|uniref:Helix-turn-helix domain-containing protein n=1 Tax=Rhizobium tumorigenes TaxID=2041385 RepID=A0AAF1KWA6_9HYPH|nr:MULTISPECIES: helix-turn-helix domain-containing protein [Rhizobium]MBO9102210.1 helix-turn-helix domain-containing protein [Rhizobium sp. L58/93]MBO9172307.1 helix-turn-helix domain-containing protein [Rhizobium sp. L245/93]MBO9188023.1 helix-turn-helix domain-containing protein [Rhizobium sp. E27B/91]QXZ87588.1 helix-turn-helix domain-containing protein [Rhizobium sp. K1/93]QXZ93628.1 helix-turn-helix domain-containing protein [Rhizobium sp. K15/93]